MPPVCRATVGRERVTDIVDSQRRSELMAGIRSRDTAPELVVRRIAYRMGLRFRLHRKDLPGQPDLVFPKHRLAVFVHGCFWHQHEACRYAHIPKSRTEYWKDKFNRNVARDRRNEQALRTLGWDVLVIWECETWEAMRIRQRLAATIRPDGYTTTLKTQRLVAQQPMRKRGR